ncbi:leucine-rich repeat domain-containing protein [Vibrio owensii]|uniref:leucine-rich repeat domain-containing protein n=1 Tax=Vibrio owensii TaxID=696485 RepID=UPI000EFC4038|nr:leucine-rich repeat domain-containing protein [Vibrio owensii]AYO19894.1 leucine-rich repeat domain-containing protein [Vibrio owensii]
MKLSKIKFTRATGQVLGSLFSLSLLTGCEHATEGLVYRPNHSDNKFRIIRYVGDEKDVIIPDSVSIIGDYAFSNDQLTSVIIPDSVKIIGRRAFQDSKLTSLILPDSIVTIGDEAFKNNQLTNVTIPDSMIAIRRQVFLVINSPV